MKNKYFLLLIISAVMITGLAFARVSFIGGVADDQFVYENKSGDQSSGCDRELYPFDCENDYAPKVGTGASCGGYYKTCHCPKKYKLTCDNSTPYQESTIVGKEPYCSDEYTKGYAECQCATGYDNTCVNEYYKPREGAASCALGDVPLYKISDCVCQDKYQYDDSNCYNDYSTYGKSCGGKYEGCGCNVAETSCPSGEKCIMYCGDSVCGNCEPDGTGGGDDGTGGGDGGDGGDDGTTPGGGGDDGTGGGNGGDDGTNPGGGGDDGQGPACTYSYTTASCSAICKGTSGNSCTKNNNTYYQSCGDSKCDLNTQECDNGTCKNKATCTYTITAEDCAADCLNVGSDSCTRNNKTYYKKCGGSKCSAGYFCESGTCVGCEQHYCIGKGLNSVLQTCCKTSCRKSKDWDGTCDNLIDCSYCRTQYGDSDCVSASEFACQKGTAWNEQVGGLTCGRR